jgi:glycine hydroxymethyltransferase
MLGIAGMEPVFLPFDRTEMNIDLEGTRSVIEEEQPSMIILGASQMLFPLPIQDIRRFYDGIILYDAAHVLGLIAGGIFQKPLHEGADVITTSTHKTFFGPQGGMILTDNAEMYEKTMSRTFDIVSNHHLHRMPALAAACFEMMEFGKDYATSVVRNAKFLGNALFEEGINVLGSKKGFTESHQVIADVSMIDNNFKVMKKLESVNILASPCPVPWNNGVDTGIRFGVQELTRRGMGENEMGEIAELACEVLFDEKRPESVRKRVTELAEKFNEIRFCLPSRKIINE